MKARPWPLLLILSLACALAALAALAIGPSAVAPAAVVDALLGRGPDAAVIVLDVRLPRVLLALAIGAALAQAGVVMQALFRNPLAEPGLAGISSGAALAAVTVLVLGWPASGWGRWLLPVATFAGGAATAALVIRLARADGQTRMATLLLAGLAINAIAAAGIGLLSHMASDQALRNLTFWLFGSLGKAGWTELQVALPLLLLPLWPVTQDAARLNAMLLGEAEAGHLGVPVERLKRRLLFWTVLLAATAVSVAGLIAFVGLVVPHLVRQLTGPDHRRLLPCAALAGATLLVLADALARTVLAPADLPIGILTALVGGPFFLALLARRAPDWTP